MQSQRTVAPGQNGTKKLVEQYGGRLVGVRYRDDAHREVSVKTIEIIIAEAKYQPRPHRIREDQLVGLQVAFREADIQQKVRQAGGQWNPTRRVWEIRYDRAVALGLKDRIVSEEVSICRNKKASTDRN